LRVASARTASKIKGWNGIPALDLPNWLTAPAIIEKALGFFLSRKNNLLF
jgi:hypothetical protein